MFNSPYAKGGMQTNGPKSPRYASGGDLNQNPEGCKTQQQQPWNQWDTSARRVECPGRTPSWGRFPEQQARSWPKMRPLSGSWAGYERTNLSVPAGPTMPASLLVRLSAAEQTTRVASCSVRPLSPQQMRQLTRPGSSAHRWLQASRWHYRPSARSGGVLSHERLHLASLNPQAQGQRPGGVATGHVPQQPNLGLGPNRYVPPTFNWGRADLTAGSRSTPRWTGTRCKGSTCPSSRTTRSRIPYMQQLQGMLGMFSNQYGGPNRQPTLPVW